MKYTDEDFKLCYVEGDWAYFTTQDVTRQWGDDWNDAPYEHNAGDPYLWQEYMEVEPYEIKTVAFYGPLVQPNYGTFNSQYSVQMINSGAIAWLKTKEWTIEQVSIYAGTALPEFIKLIKQVGGSVFLSVEDKE